MSLFEAIHRRRRPLIAIFGLIAASLASLGWTLRQESSASIAIGRPAAFSAAHAADAALRSACKSFARLERPAPAGARLPTAAQAQWSVECLLSGFSSRAPFTAPREQSSAVMKEQVRLFFAMLSATERSLQESVPMASSRDRARLSEELRLAASEGDAGVRSALGSAMIQTELSSWQMASLREGDPASALAAMELSRAAHATGLRLLQKQMEAERAALDKRPLSRWIERTISGRDLLLIQAERQAALSESLWSGYFIAQRPAQRLANPASAFSAAKSLARKRSKTAPLHTLSPEDFQLSDSESAVRAAAQRPLP